MTQVTPPNGASWQVQEMSKGNVSIGAAPVLVWSDAQAAVDFYGIEAILDAINGVSIGAACASIARRMKIAGKSDDEIAQRQLSYKPGKRVAPTPATRAKRAVAEAAAVVNGDAIAALLGRIKRGEVTLDANGNIQTA